MSHFYCREQELKKLNARYEDADFECAIIYGRRRVGKTALINEFCKGKPTIFYSALNTTEKENLVPVWERITISLEEAAAYSGIGVRKLRDMTDKPECNYVIWVGNRRMIKRKKFDEYLESAYSI